MFLSDNFPFCIALWLSFYCLLIFSQFLVRRQENDLSSSFGVFYFIGSCFFFGVFAYSLLRHSITVSSKSFMKANSRSDFNKANFQQVRKMDRLDSMRGSTTETYTEETFGPLSVMSALPFLHKSNFRNDSAMIFYFAEC